MNRSIALFVALVTLLAHVLAIHADADGNLAFPYEQAYTAFRLGRNLIQYGYVQWGAEGGGVESCTSLLWILVSALGERFTNHINLFVQSVAIGSGLLTVVLLSRFRAKRSAGLIAPLLFVCSGAAAAACGSGMENTLFCLCLLFAFFALERGFPLLLAAALVLLVLARADGVVFALLLLALALAPGGALRGWRLWLPFGVAWAIFLLEALAWKNSSGSAWHPSLRALVEPHDGQAGEGWSSLSDFVRIAPSPLLLLFPLLCVVRGKLSTLGWRALALCAAFTLVVVLGGRSPLPFGQAFLPALPFLFLAIQEGLIEALDGRTILRRVGLTGLFGVLVLSALASKEPGDVGPLHLGTWARAWMRSNGSARAGYEEPLARAGLLEELANTNHLRAAGIFLRDHVDPAATVLSPWPSAIAYLSRLEVTDLLGRTNPIEGIGARGAWTRRERTDVVAALAEQRDYLIPRIHGLGPPPSRRELAEEWAREFDLHPDEHGRVDEIERGLAAYSLLTVPVQGYVRAPTQPKPEPFFLLCHKRVRKWPVLQIQAHGDELELHVRCPGHAQNADLCLRAFSASGQAYWVRPTLELSKRAVVARAGLLLSDSGEREIELLRWKVPAEIVRVEARLLNPGAVGESDFALAGEPADWKR